MKGFNFNVKFCGLNGSTPPDAMHMGEFLGELLAGDTKQPQDAIKYDEWARKLFSRKKLLLDRSDAEKLKEFVTVTQGVMGPAGVPIGVPATLRSQLLLIMERASEEAVDDSDEKKKADNDTDKS